MTGKKPPIGNTTLRQAISEDVVKRLAAQNIPAARIEAKLKHTGAWWAASGLFVLVSLLFAGGAFYVALQKDMSLTLAVLLGVPVLLCVCAALFCASQASAEATKAALGTILDFARGARRLEKPEDK